MIRWVDSVGLLRYWVRDCDAEYFPGDNPDAGMVDIERYGGEAPLSRNQVGRCVYGVYLLALN